PMALILASITVLIASGIWRYFKKEKYHDYSFFMSQGFYLLGMLGTLHFMKIDFDPTLRAVIFFGGILMAYLLYQKTKSTIVPYVMSSIFLVFYLTVLFAIHMNYTISSSLFSSLQLSVGAFLLLGTLHFMKIDFDPTLRAVIFFGGILMAYLLYQKTKSTIVPYVMSSIFLVFYLTVLFAIHMNYTISSSLFSSLQLSVGAFLL